MGGRTGAHLINPSNNGGKIVENLINPSNNGRIANIILIVNKKLESLMLN